MQKIVVVDDNEHVRGSLELLLSSLDYQVDCFDSAEAFLDSDDISKSVCLLLDLNLPGMDGCQLVQELRRQKIDTPAILLSGSINANTESKLREIPAVKVLAKPCSGPVLFDAIEAAVQQGAQANQNDQSVGL